MPRQPRPQMHVHDDSRKAVSKRHVVSPSSICSRASAIAEQSTTDVQVWWRAEPDVHAVPMPTLPADRPAIDAEFLGLVDVEGGVRFTVELRHSRPDLRLFGGAAIAVSLAAIERVSGQEVLWATAQLVGTAAVGATVDCAVDVLAAGHRTSQLRVTATSEDRLVFQALGAAATLKEPDGTLVGEGAAMPAVAPPDACPP